MMTRLIEKLPEKNQAAISSEKSRKDTLNAKRLKVRRAIEDLLENKRFNAVYGSLEEINL